jgi:hypothetical protein
VTNRPAARALLDAALDMPSARALAARFLPSLAPPERGVRAVLLYGSRLWEQVRGAGSQPDFIVIVDSLAAYGGPALALLGFLPPIVYRCQLEGGESAKVSVVTVSQLQRYCSAAAPDLYLLGRLSKRVALVWKRDFGAQRLVADAQWAGLELLGRLALTRCGPDATVDDFMRLVLGISYESEVRIVERNKVQALFDVEREHYRAIGSALLLHLGARPAADGLRFTGRPGDIESGAAELTRRLRRSRRRAVLRWPKLLWTYDGWLEYLLAKLERTGTSVALTPAQRRHPLLLATPVLYRLARAHKVH